MFPGSNLSRWEKRGGRRLMSSPDLRVHPQKTSTTEADVPVGAEFAAHPIGSYITAEGQLLRTTGGRFTGEMCAGFLSRFANLPKHVISARQPCTALRMGKNNNRISVFITSCFPAVSACLVSSRECSPRPFPRLQPANKNGFGVRVKCEQRRSKMAVLPAARSMFFLPLVSLRGASQLLQPTTNCIAASAQQSAAGNSPTGLIPPRIVWLFL